MAVAVLPRMHITINPPVEAREWLRNNPSRSAFATNRFGETANALEFVQALYARGATQVLVDNPGIDADGSPYADTFLVRYPPTGGTRRELERFCEENGPGGLPPGDFTMHVFDREIRLWWD